MRIPQSGLRVDSPSWPLLQALISFWGVTDADGLVGGTTIRCGALALEPSYANHALKILSGPAAGQIRDVTTHPAGTDTVTVVAAFSNVGGVAQQITAGTLFVILSKTPAIAEVADLTVIVLALVADIVGATGIFHEQEDVGFSLNITAAETFIVTLNAADTRYILRDLRIKSADPTAANTITVKLYTLINSIEVNVDSFIITNANFGIYFTLVDMFGVPHIAGDSIRVSLQGSAAGPYVVAGQFSHAKNNV